MTACVDLRTKAGYRLLNELTGRRATARDDPGELVIPGRLGHVSPWGDADHLLASTNSTKMTNKILEAVPGAVVTQDGDDGQNVRFPVSAFDTVADLLRLRKVRRLTPEARAKAVANLRPFSANPVAGVG